MGVAFGLIFTLTSSGVSSILGLYDKPDHQKEKLHAKRDPPPRDDDEDAQGYQRSSSPPRLPDIEQENLEALLARLDSPDSDLGSLTRTGWRDGPKTNKRQRRSAAALRIGTILEEDDDSL